MATAIICEFNPFHNGHKYLLQTAKMITNQPIVAIMSGSFTQRGEVAITDKFTRTKTALQNGADLVIELPTAYAISNAQRFATAGTQLAAAFPVVNTLAFGCESDNTENLLIAANAINDNDVKATLKQNMKSGEYYPKALENAVRKIKGDTIADILATPNNILAVEYLRGLKGTNINPLPIKRIGVEHDSKISTDTIASASHIRELVRNNQTAESFAPYIPNNITYPEKLDIALLYKLRSMSCEDIAKLPDISEGLENRIYSAVKSCNSVSEIIESVKTKRYTHARIRRILCSALLSITEELQNTPIEYVRVLGFSSIGASLLKDCKLSVVTSVSNGLKLSENIKKLLSNDILATDIAALAYESTQKCNADFTTPIIKINTT
ncbi:MAG: nucleotidyltransferase family protein [Ruminococcus sp.]|nr:nucleotidyltransferase family protein [Ruminococcus sp.]